MFATGYWIYGDYNYAISLTITAVISGVLLIKVWNKIRTTIL
jgi:ABC-type glucose/galactose transport system permease subunit